MSGVPVWKKKPFWIRLLHWEFWGFHLVYVPIYPIFILLCLRARSFFFFAAANPMIKNGGFLGESKKDIYELMPPGLQPKSLFFSADTNPTEVLNQVNQAGFQFPLMGKPDMGGRGRGVKKLDHVLAVLEYAKLSGVNFHIQEYISYENEAGIFYYRIPGRERGNISGIVKKEFLKAAGNGIWTVRELLQQNPRGILQLEQLEKTEPEMLNMILPAGEHFVASPYGNHARGAMFLDDSASVNRSLEEVIDAICKQIPSFYYGRLDIRYKSRQLLDEGKCFSIIEVNGAGSEPTHIYDPRHTIFFAWKEIIRHWLLLFKISRANHCQGYSYLSFKQGLEMFRVDKMNSKLLSGQQNMKS